MYACLIGRPDHQGSCFAFTRAKYRGEQTLKRSRVTVCEPRVCSGPYCVRPTSTRSRPPPWGGWLKEPAPTGTSCAARILRSSHSIRTAAVVIVSLLLGHARHNFRGSMPGRGHPHLCDLILCLPPPLAHSHPELLRRGTADTWGRITRCGAGRPGHRTELRSMPGFSPQLLGT